METQTGVERHEQTLEYDTLRDALVAASEAAMTTFGRAIPGVMYTQGGRRLFSTSLPLGLVARVARLDSAKRKGDPSPYHNRPLDLSHVKAIAQYLLTERRYLLSALTLSANRPIRAFAVRAATSSNSKLAVFILPQDADLYVTDGQHRLKAIEEALRDRPELADDSIGVTIVEEADLDKVHQDFFDLSQVLRLPPSLLVEYDGREPLNWFTRAVSNNAQPFKGRTERINNVGKNSLMLFTSNQIKQGILQLLVGDWSLFADALEQRAQQMLATEAKAIWLTRILAFFEHFTEQNPEWKQVRDNPLTTVQTVDVPDLRNKYLHFSGAGLLVLTGVGHAILELEANTDGSLSDGQKVLIRQLASLDWSKGGPLWQNSVVGPQGNITPHKNNVVVAVAKVKRQLDLPLTDREKGHLTKAEAPSVPEPAMA